MITFPNAKINIGLQITEKRSDGYHNLISCFYPVPWSDILEIIPSNTTQFTSSGIAIPGDSSDNLCLKAYNLLAQDHPLSPVHIHLHKVVPIGAGMGGGSSDAAFTLKSLNTLFSLGLDNETLQDYARELGSDCAFFIENKPVLAVEKGDVFNPISLSLLGHHLLIVYPNTHISTKEAYSHITPQVPDIDLPSVLSQAPSTWRDVIVNDFEKGIMDTHPTLKNLKNSLYEHGAIYASMTGSGSAFFGIYSEKPPLDPFKEYLTFYCSL